MVDLTHVSDEDVVKVHYILTRLMDGLSGGFNNPDLWDMAVELEKSCLIALRKGSDNQELADRLEKEGHTNLTFN